MSLTAQFLLGMAVNLFIDIPKDHPGANPSEYFSGVVESVTWAVLHGPLLLVLHSALGLVLVTGGVLLAVLAVRTGRRGYATACVVGVVAILAAGFNGGSFLNYNEDFSSMIMASFLGVALVAYSAAIYVAPAA